MCLHLQHLFQKFWPHFDSIFLRNARSSSWGPEDPITGLLIFSRMFWLWVWLETKSRLIDISRRISTRDQRAPSAFRRSRKECNLLARMFCVRFLILSSRSFFCNTTHHALRLSHPVSDYFCYSMGAINRLFHLSLFLGLVFTFFICFRIICIQYGGELSSPSSGSPEWFSRTVEGVQGNICDIFCQDSLVIIQEGIVQI